MQFDVSFTHRVNSEELAAHGLDRAAWELMFRQYLESVLDVNITQVKEVMVDGKLPTAVDPNLVY